MKPTRAFPRIPTGPTTSRRILTTLALVLAAGASASPSPPPPIDELTGFYEATGGDNWRRNDHWLDEEVHHCQWYGIRCDAGLSISPMTGLVLPDNNLVGNVADAIEWVETLPLDSSSAPARIDLAGNQLTGELPRLLPFDQLDLSDNLITGALPAIDESTGEWLRTLDLSGNQLSGSIPASWAGLELTELRLDRNQLTGEIEVAIDAMSMADFVRLDLADNQFSSQIPVALMALLPYPLDERQTGPMENGWKPAFPPGLNLCWNDFDPPAGELADFIALHHHGGRFAECQRPQVPIDPTISGSWFNPDRNGEGFVQQLLDNGRMLTFWFTYPRDENAGQRWFLGLEPAGDTGVWMEDLLAPVGQFGAGNREPETPREELDQAIPFRLSINRLEDERQHIAYSRSVILGGSATGLASFGLDSLRYDQIVLTRLAGTTCENQGDFQEYSGAWYNPERSGEGFVIEVLPDDEAVVYWFTYQPDGSGQQAWMVGQGQISKPHSVVLSPVFPPEASMDLYQPVGTAFGAGFDPDEIELLEWGQIHFEFHPPDSGTVEWESNLEGYGSGEFPIERLTQPMLADCD
jgi:hypothetical protein